jgi:hypothetical protein
LKLIDLKILKEIKMDTNKNKKPETNQPSKAPPSRDNAPEKQTPTENEPRRYDEADPNWRNPDVQMRNGENTNVNTPSEF